MLAKHGRRLLALLDDSPVTPGDGRPAYNGGSHARQILDDAEDDLKAWQPTDDQGSQYETPLHDTQHASSNQQGVPHGLIAGTEGHATSQGVSQGGTDLSSIDTVKDKQGTELENPVVPSQPS